MTTVSNLLKEIYEGTVHDQLQTEVTGLKRIETSSEGVTSEVGGSYVRFPIRTKRNQGLGARAEGQALPVPGKQSYESAYIPLMNLYGSIQLTGQTFALAEKNFQAFASALDQEVTGLKEYLRKDLARQVYGDGSGTLAVANAAGSTTTFKCSDAQATYLEEDMVIDIYDNTDTLRASGKTITGLSSDGTTTTVTFTTAAGTSSASGDYLVRTGNLNNEITGLGAIVQDEGELYGVDPSTVPVWKSIVDDNGGTLRAFTEGLAIDICDQLRKKGGGTPTAAFMGLGVRRAYFNLLSQQRRITNTLDFEGGFKALGFTYNGTEIPMVDDVDSPSNEIVFLNEKEIKIYAEDDWAFMDRDGSRWERVSDSTGKYDAYSATMFRYMELGTHRRNAHARLKDLIEG